MTNVRKLLSDLTVQEEQFRATQFLAPCVRGGRVRARVAGLVCGFAVRPFAFEGYDP